MSQACLAWQAAPVQSLLGSYGLVLVTVTAGTAIPGSFWGDAEAGLRGNAIYVRDDTPLHSLLHEAGHYLCMSSRRRAGLDTDAGGDDLEECAVCYLQVLLGERCGVARSRMFADMDAWGYSFRLGAAQSWFERDAGDARDWLHRHGLIDDADVLTGRLRQACTPLPSG